MSPSTIKIAFATAKLVPVLKLESNCPFRLIRTKLRYKPESELIVTPTTNLPSGCKASALIPLVTPKDIKPTDIIGFVSQASGLKLLTSTQGTSLSRRETRISWTMLDCGKSGEV